MKEDKKIGMFFVQEDSNCMAKMLGIFANSTMCGVKGRGNFVVQEQDRKKSLGRMVHSKFTAKWFDDDVSEETLLTHNPHPLPRLICFRCWLAHISLAVLLPCTVFFMR